MRTTELVLTAVVILGCIFKVQHWPCAAALIISGTGGLALFYFPFGFRTLPSPKPTDQVLWMSFVASTALCATLCGLMAFLQRWPYSAVLLQVGAGACAVTLLIGLWMRYKHPRFDIYFDGLLIRCLVLGGLAITLWALFSGKPR